MPLKITVKAIKHGTWYSFLLSHRYAFVFLLAFLAYANTCFNDYNLDDELVTRNHWLTSQRLGIDNLHKIFKEPYYKDNMGYSYGYRPLTLLSFAIEHSIFGDSPHISHFFNILFYCLLCIVLLKVLELMFPNTNKAFYLMAITIFIVHPIHTEVVASIKNRDQILSFLFGALSLCFLLPWRGSFYLRLGVSLTCYIAGMLCKPDILMLAPIMVIVLQFFREENVLHTLLMSTLFSLASVYFIENISDTLKIYYIIANFAFTTSIVALGNCWLKLNMFFPGRDNAKEVAHAPAYLSLRGFKYFLFLFVNIVIGMGFIAAAVSYSESAFLIPITVIYALELYFFSIEQLWPIILCLDGICLFIMAGLEQRQYVVDGFIIFFAMFNLSLILYLKRKRFIVLFILCSAFLIICRYHFISDNGLKENIVPVFNILIPFSIIAVLYHTGIYKSVYVRAIMAIVLILNIKGILFDKEPDGIGLVDKSTPVLYILVFCAFIAKLLGSGIYKSLYLRGLIVMALILCIKDNILEINSLNINDIAQVVYHLLYLALMLLIGICVYLNVAIKRFSALFGCLQVGYIAVFLIINTFAIRGNSNSLFQNSIRKVSIAKGQINQISANVVNGAGNLPSAYKNIKIDRPATMIELPVQHDAPLSIKAATSAYQFSRYIALLIKPWPMGFYYGYNEIRPHKLNEPIIILSLILFASMLLGAFLLILKNKLLSFSFFFIILSIFPYLAVASDLRGMLGDRYAFQASFGFSILLAYCFFYLYSIPANSLYGRFISPQKIKKPTGITFVLLLLFYATATVARNAQWKDAVTLMRHDIGHLDQSAQAHNLLATHLVNQSFAISDLQEQYLMRGEALGHLKKANEIFPEYFNFVFDIGRIYSMLNMPDSALVYFKKGIPLNRDYDLSYLNIADIYFSQGKWADAIPYLQPVIKLNPKDYTGYDKLSFAYFKLEEFGKSIEVNRKAMAEIPDNVLPLMNLGRTFIQMKEPDSARYYLKKADSLAPGNPMVQQLLLQAGQ